MQELTPIAPVTAAAPERAAAGALPTVSIIIPMFNEEANVAPLWEQLLPVLDAGAHPFEVIFVNDGSSDGTEPALARVAQADPRVKVINFKRNFGQTAAMMAGIDHSRGEIIVPMDGDLQNDPADIAMLVAKLDDG
jgi:dolichol-phosphate mannosyltransferase